MRGSLPNGVKIEFDHTRGSGGTEHGSLRRYIFYAKPRQHTFNGNLLVKIFAIIFALLLFSNLIAVLRGDTNTNLLSFEQLIQSIGNAPTIDLKNIDLTTGLVDEDWGALDFLREFLVGFFNSWVGEFINLLVFLAAGLANAFIFITYFLRLFFAL